MRGCRPPWAPLRFAACIAAALSLLALSSTSARAIPTQYAFSQVPSRFRTLELTAASRGLGEICYSRGAMPDGTYCNPAFLPEQRENKLLIRLFAGNGYDAASTANEFLNKPITREFLRQLFEENNTLSLEAHVGLLFSTRYFQAGFSPYRVQYLSEVHNPNLPVIAVHASNERSIGFGGGVPLSLLDPGLKDFTAGARLRLLERTYVHGTFSSIQLLSPAEDPKDYLPVKEQKAFYFDPTIGWLPSGAPWKMRVSAGIHNWGPTIPDDPLYPDPTDLVLGYGVEVPVPYGTWHLGLDVVDVFTAEDFGDRFRFGTSYHYGVIEPMLGINSSSFTLGIQFGIQFFQAGIVYEFVRKDLESNEARSRISTEIAIQF